MARNGQKFIGSPWEMISFVLWRELLSLIGVATVPIHQIADCSALQAASALELFAPLSDRISKLEHQMSSQPLTLIAELKESIANHEWLGNSQNRREDGNCCIYQKRKVLIRATTSAINSETLKPELYHAAEHVIHHHHRDLSVSLRRSRMM
jgi:hypothetical protein